MVTLATDLSAEAVPLDQRGVKQVIPADFTPDVPVPPPVRRYSYDATVIVPAGTDLSTGALAQLPATITKATFPIDVAVRIVIEVSG